MFCPVLYNVHIYSVNVTLCLQPGPRGGGVDENDYNDGPNYICEEAPEEAYEEQYEYESQNYGEVKVNLPTKHYYGGKYQ